MIKRNAGWVLAIALACTTGTTFAADAPAASAVPAGAAPATATPPVTLADDHPTSYTVQKGDTLWGIAERFLKNPWQWPQVWHVNEQVANPHLIFPGDVINLVWRNGMPYLERNGQGSGSSSSLEIIDANTVKMHPRIREMELSAAIPAIPLRNIEVLLTDSRVVAGEDLKKAPYVISGADSRVIMGNGDTMFVRSTTPKWSDTFTEYGVFRPGAPYIDPKTKEVLGYEALKVGVARTIDVNRDIATMRVMSASEDIRINDRLMLNEQRKLQSTFTPRSAQEDFEGTVLRIFGTIGAAGRGSVIVINRGLREKLEEGDVVAILQNNEPVRDRRTGEAVKLPPTRAGLAIVFHSFEKVAFALITRSVAPIHTGDYLVPPRIDID